MCFSATASFVASGGLITIGAASFHLAQGKQKVVAVMPLLFGIQQAFEGFQWIALSAGQVNHVAAHGFLFFAMLFWPVYIPTTVFLLDEKKRNVLKWLLGAGIALAIALSLPLILEPLAVHALKRSVHYEVDVPLVEMAIGLYIIVVGGSLVISTKRAVRWFGIAILLAAFAAATLYLNTFASVWCFFAVILSSLVYFYLKYSEQWEAVRASS